MKLPINSAGVTRDTTYKIASTRDAWPSEECHCQASGKCQGGQAYGPLTNSGASASDCDTNVFADASNYCDGSQRRGVATCTIEYTSGDCAQ